jgi:AraC-like DNA-binding protein
MVESTYLDFPRRERFPLAVRHQVPGEVLANQYHDHEFSEIIIVNNGSGIHCIDSRRRRIERNDVLVIHPGGRHAFSDCETLDLYRIIYDCNIPLPALEAANLDFVKVVYPLGSPVDPFSPAASLPDYDHELIINLVCRLSYEIHRKRLGHTVMVPTMFVELVLYLARSDSQKIEKEQLWLLQAPVAYLSNNFRAPFDLDKLTKLAGMSERGLFRHFKKVLGMSPLQYLQQIRVQYAMERLQKSHDSIAAIAVQCGFCDSNHLCKVFRNSTGMTPLAFRKQHF